MNRRALAIAVVVGILGIFLLFLYQRRFEVEASGGERVRVLTVNGADVIGIRPCAYLSYTFDHRVLDGASADAFMATIKKQLEGWRAES